jgi:hypothetical protein
MKRKKNATHFTSEYQKVIHLRYESFVTSLYRIQAEYKCHLLEKLYDFVEDNYESLCTNDDIKYSIKRDLLFYSKSGWLKADYYIKRLISLEA